MRYLFGVAAALVAGIAFNVGVLVQKSGVDRAPKEGSLIRTLLHSPLWLLGLALQFVLGTPLYTLSIGLIGPAVVPGIMAIGLVVLAVGAVRVQKERLQIREALGIACIILAVTAFGFSHLSIDVHAYSMRDAALLERSGLLAGVFVAVALGFGVVAWRVTGGRRANVRSESAAALHAARGGLWYNVGNLGLAFISAGLARFASGVFDPVEIVVFAVALALAATGAAWGVAATQYALAVGRAAVAIPLQNAVAQLLPVCVFFLVYRPYVPARESFLFLGGAAALLVAGLVLLTARLALSGAKRAE